MTYLLKAKDSDLTKKRIDLMKRYVATIKQFDSLWIEHEEVIAPYNESMVKDYKFETLRSFLPNFIALLADFKEQGIVLDIVEKFENRFVTEENYNIMMDMGFILNVREFFFQVENRLRAVKRQVRNLKEELDTCLKSTDPKFTFDGMNLTKHHKRCLEIGERALIPAVNNNWFGKLPKVDIHLLKDADLDTLKATLEPVYDEYNFLHDYLNLLVTTLVNERVAQEEELLSNPEELRKLDTKIIFWQDRLRNKSTHLKAGGMKFSEFQRMVVFNHYLDNKKNNVERQGLENNNFVRDLVLRYDILKDLLNREFKAPVHFSLLGSLLNNARNGFESLSKVEQEVYSIYLATSLSIETKTKKAYGILEEKHLKILAIVSELHQVVGDILYHSPSSKGYFLGLQGIMSNYFVQLNPNNKKRVMSIEQFPFKLKDGIVEGYLRKYNLNQPADEPTVSTLIDLIFNRDRLIMDMDAIAIGINRMVDTVLERDEEESELLASLKDIQNVSERKRLLLKVAPL